MRFSTQQLGKFDRAFPMKMQPIQMAMLTILFIVVVGLNTLTSIWACDEIKCDLVLIPLRAFLLVFLVVIPMMSARMIMVRRKGLIFPQPNQTITSIFCLIVIEYTSIRSLEITDERILINRGFDEYTFLRKNMKAIHYERFATALKKNFTASREMIHS
jgi:hypothetical protein